MFMMLVVLKCETIFMGWIQGFRIMIGLGEITNETSFLFVNMFLSDWWYPYPCLVSCKCNSGVVEGQTVQASSLGALCWEELWLGHLLVYMHLRYTNDIFLYLTLFNMFLLPYVCSVSILIAVSWVELW